MAQVICLLNLAYHGRSPTYSLYKLSQRFIKANWKLWEPDSGKNNPEFSQTDPEGHVKYTVTYSAECVCLVLF